MINENQHKILALPNVQELIKALDLEIHDSSYSTRIAISKRVDGWLDKLASQAPRPRLITTDQPINKSEEGIKAWINQMTDMNGRSWCPFCIAILVGLLITFCGETPMRQPVADPGSLAGWESLILNTRGLRNIIRILKAYMLYLLI